MKSWKFISCFQFYNLPGLVELCGVQPLKEGDEVNSKKFREKNDFWANSYNFDLFLCKIRFNGERTRLTSTGDRSFDTWSTTLFRYLSFMIGNCLFNFLFFQI